MQLSHLYSELPPNFYQKVTAFDFKNPELLYLNNQLSDELALNLPTNKNECAQFFTGALQNDKHLAMTYAGHQFGHFNPQLGDGRALLLGEITTENKTYELHLKGSGPTAFSRRGDGFCPLGPALREYIISEAMHQLNVPTSRTLAVVKTNDTIYRETPLPGAVITRVAESHIRFGSFEYFAHRNDIGGLTKLADFAIERHDPDLVDAHDKYDLFFKRVCLRTLSTVSQWMSLGFIHGVMNTDNMTISGQTIDYGPCAFMNEYNSMQVYSFIDQQGRYAYGNQGHIAIWNLSCLANALFPIIHLTNETEPETKVRLTDYFKKLENSFKTFHTQDFSRKLGFFNSDENDPELIKDMLNYMQINKLDFTNTFRNLNTFTFVDKNIESRWLERIESQKQSKEDIIKLMKSVNPSIIPRNSIVNEALDAANNDDFKLFESIYQEIKSPFEDNNETLLLQQASINDIENTFCGT